MSEISEDDSVLENSKNNVDQESEGTKDNAKVIILEQKVFQVLFLYTYIYILKQY